MTLPIIPDDDTGQIRLVLDTMKSIVDAAGHGFVYQRPGDHKNFGACWYVHPTTGQADCLAGRVLYALGVPLEVLHKQEGESTDLLEPEDSPVWLGHSAMQVLATAQSLQDEGHTWGQALRRAQENAALYGVRDDG